MDVQKETTIIAEQDAFVMGFRLATQIIVDGLTNLPVRFHDLRHTFATIALQNSVDIKTVLGHFSTGFTLDIYAHVTTAAKKEAALTMGNVLSV